MFSWRPDPNLQSPRPAQLSFHKILSNPKMKVRMTKIYWMTAVFFSIHGIHNSIRILMYCTFDNYFTKKLGNSVIFIPRIDCSKLD